MSVGSAIEIRRATADDAASILELQKLAYRSEAELYEDWSIPPLTQTLGELLEEFASMRILKASRETSLIGSVRAKISEAGVDIGRLIVHPAHQGKGLGRRLMQAIEVECNAPRYELFTGSRSERNIRLYESLGYKTFRTQQVAPGLTLVFMEKNAVRP